VDPRKIAGQADIRGQFGMRAPGFEIGLPSFAAMTVPLYRASDAGLRILRPVVVQEITAR
jgi:hypothetical protein